MDKYYFIIIVILGVMMFLGKLFYGTNKSQEKFTKEYNKKHKTNFKTHSDLMNYIRSLKEKERAKKHEEEKSKEKERQKEEKTVASEPSDGGSLTGKITRLKRLYKSGTLTKAEFEKAKNNLLK